MLQKVTFLFLSIRQSKQVDVPSLPDNAVLNQPSLPNNWPNNPVLNGPSLPNNWPTASILNGPLLPNNWPTAHGVPDNGWPTTSSTPMIPNYSMGVVYPPMDPIQNGAAFPGNGRPTATPDTFSYIPQQLPRPFASNFDPINNPSYQGILSLFERLCRSSNSVVFGSVLCSRFIRNDEELLSELDHHCKLWNDHQQLPMTEIRVNRIELAHDGERKELCRLLADLDSSCSLWKNKKDIPKICRRNELITPKIQIFLSPIVLPTLTKTVSLMPTSLGKPKILDHQYAIRNNERNSTADTGTPLLSSIGAKVALIGSLSAILLFILLLCCLKLRSKKGGGKGVGIESGRPIDENLLKNEECSLSVKPSFLSKSLSAFVPKFKKSKSSVHDIQPASQKIFDKNIIPHSKCYPSTLEKDEISETNTHISSASKKALETTENSEIEAVQQKISGCDESYYDWTNTIARPEPSSHVVKKTYQPRRPDEMHLQVGDVIGIEKVYDDGWARVQNISQGRKRCMVPLKLLTYIRTGPSQNVMNGNAIPAQFRNSEVFAGGDEDILPERKESMSTYRG